ncbi:hypothetical protein [Okeania sp. KiyG1]|uniref:hypothetical protein n=1 Tax=Okeania sp. KiyG1 TaxID=2720165 RepID=UPI001924E125|nr:hypothetical protein [Okeania sp. KiyG1]GGA51773.1 hypothetical protein CYANOKiyG1_71510 [Okeania sp. KiyG1]
MEILAFSHLAFNEEDSANKEFTACVDFKKLSSVGAMGLLSAATLAVGMNVTADSASAYYGGGYGRYGSYGAYGSSGRYGSYGRVSGHYYKKVVSRSYSRSYGSYGRYNRYGRRGSYGGYGGYDGDCYY